MLCYSYEYIEYKRKITIFKILDKFKADIFRDILLWAFTHFTQSNLASCTVYRFCLLLGFISCFYSVIAGHEQTFILLNSMGKHIWVLDMVARTTDWFPGLFYLNMNFPNFGHCKYFCFVLNCPVAL